MNAIVPMPRRRADAPASGRRAPPFSLRARRASLRAAPSFDEIPIGAIVFGKRVGTGAFGDVLPELPGHGRGGEAAPPGSLAAAGG